MSENIMTDCRPSSRFPLVVNQSKATSHEPRFLSINKIVYSVSFDIHHVIGFSDLVDLWVIKIKKPMILCARSTSRSSEQSTITQ